MSRACSVYGVGRGVYRVLIGKPEGKTLLGRPRRRWEDNVKIDLQEVGCGEWIGLAQDRDRWLALVNAAMNHPVPLNAGNFLTGCKPVSSSRRTVLCGVSNVKAQRLSWFDHVQYKECQTTEQSRRYSNGIP
jgi:hypothetical protein